MALASCYTLVGFIPSFIATPLSVYLVRELNAHPTTQNQVAICTSLPWAWKIVFGFLSDAFPLLGQRRKPYIFLGTALSTAAYLALASVGRPSAPALGAGLCLATVGLVMADTMSDALVVERSRTEPEGEHGHLQSELYAYRFGGAVAGAVAGALLYNRQAGWGWGLRFAEVMAVAGCLPLLLLLPLLWPLREMPLAHGHHRQRQRQATTLVPRSEIEGIVEIGVRGDGKESGEVGEEKEEEEEQEEVGFMSVSAQARQIWEIIQLPIVSRPMLFVFVYNLLQSTCLLVCLFLGGKGDRPVLLTHPITFSLTRPPYLPLHTPQQQHSSQRRLVLLPHPQPQVHALPPGLPRLLLPRHDLPGRPPLQALLPPLRLAPHLHVRASIGSSHGPPG